MKKLNWLLVGILILASALRLLFLNTHMPALYGDEIAIGYNAYSILKTGRDEFGKFMPLQFQSWGDQKESSLYLRRRACPNIYWSHRRRCSFPLSPRWHLCGLFDLPDRQKNLN